MDHETPPLPPGAVRIIAGAVAESMIPGHREGDQPREATPCHVDPCGGNHGDLPKIFNKNLDMGEWTTVDGGTVEFHHNSWRLSG